MNIVLPLLLAGTGVVVGIVGYYNRDSPTMRKGDLKAIYYLAVGQVAIGLMFWLVFSR